MERPVCQDPFLSKSSQQVDIRLHPKGRGSPVVAVSDVQLWRKVSSRSELDIRAHNVLRTPLQVPEIGGQAESLASSTLATQPNTSIPSDMDPRPMNSSGMKRHASSLLVFSGHSTTPTFCGTLFSRVPSKQRPHCLALV